MRAGEVISTLGIARRNRIISIDRDGVLVESERSAAKRTGPQRVQAWMITTAWEHLCVHGRLTIQAINLTANTSYIVRLSGTTPTQLGNYSLSVIANQSAFVPQTFATGTISQGQWGQNLVVAQNEVFHFLFGLTGSSADAVRMTVEGLNGTIYYDVTVTGGSTANVRPVLLKTGTYLIRYNRISGISAITFSLRGAVLSDPIGPSAQDPTQNPAGPGSDLGTYYLQVLHRLKSLLKNMPMADVF